MTDELAVSSVESKELPPDWRGVGKPPRPVPNAWSRALAKEWGSRVRACSPRRCPYPKIREKCSVDKWAGGHCRYEARIWRNTYKIYEGVFGPVIAARAASHAVHEVRAEAAEARLSEGKGGALAPFSRGVQRYRELALSFTKFLIAEQSKRMDMVRRAQAEQPSALRQIQQMAERESSVSKNGDT